MSPLAFVHLLILHPDASGKIYVMYGGAYVAAALAWLKISLTAWGMAGGLMVPLRVLIIIVRPR
ncbi:hypothetical protein [Moraxella bovis]|uniref:hypothetical protein n=1 Tax=Moraxella bovis TaxID=476 RepID=UPI00222788C9|nr:hypothetical protein [Moraxella bovis]UYZ69441.1 hypothetical protein LP122_05075 [Moraxella bovis]UYZ93776.1 hypothetical protein LP121_07605 [Moraxella bovis]UZA15109.1 hypothetical protein LP102_05070 [Moraxella bovis]UZA26535.1 hypothetical protein LP119_07785 [Moraxella bovis]UZA38935.1 hypothetical protein LP101_05090 [Moraxella bovis]